MRRPSVFTQNAGELDIKMTPMIDVVFLLLVFFVCTARFEIEHVLPSSLSTAAGAAPADPNDLPPPEHDFDDVVVRIEWIDGAPSWRINDVRVKTLDELRSRLDRIARIRRDAPVILDPDQQVPIGSVIKVYDISRLVGFEKVQFAASEDL